MVIILQELRDSDFPHRASISRVNHFREVRGNSGGAAESLAAAEREGVSQGENQGFLNAAALLWAQKPLRVREFSSSDSPLWKILHNHYEYFNAGHDKDCEKQCGFFRPVVDEVV